jgi:hypothetical protein
VLYPKLAYHGAIIVDDYGTYDGARLAVDEYFNGRNIRPFFSFIDKGARIGTRPYPIKSKDQEDDI